MTSKEIISEKQIENALWFTLKEETEGGFSLFDFLKHHEFILNFAERVAEIVIDDAHSKKSA
ncbi:hypothetical protein KAI04_00060 [Candidatus Pacearchaeota archaeon]|nr:hypothetical protein [Candidatus Pacearchaeota archaeon]